MDRWTDVQTKRLTGSQEDPDNLTYRKIKACDTVYSPANAVMFEYRIEPNLNPFET